MVNGMDPADNESPSNPEGVNSKVTRRSVLASAAATSIVSSGIVGATDQDLGDRTTDVVRGIKNGETTYERVSQDWAEHIQHVSEVKQKLVNKYISNPAINKIGITGDSGNYISGHKKAKVL